MTLVEKSLQRQENSRYICDKILACDVCGKQYTEVRKLKTHVFTHTREKHMNRASVEKTLHKQQP